MLYYARSSESDVFDSITLQSALYSALGKIGAKQKVLVIPPDFTRYHSKAGDLTTFIHSYYKDKLSDVLPALGTHVAMTENEIEKMFTNVPKNLFRIHNWRNDLVTLGYVPSKFIKD